jgi:methylated-DNA-[protein]-cysteine S-methyltransferase
MGQSDCPEVPGLNPGRKARARPSEGRVDGREIRKFRAHKNALGTAAGPIGIGAGSPQGTLFEPESLPSTAPVRRPGRDPDGMGDELIFPEDGIPADVQALFAETRSQLADYFAGTRKVFDIPLHTSGTSFQQKVWQALRAIPYGELVSYADVAQSAGLTRGHGRPVGAVVGQNPITIIIPCHRVVSSSGLLTGYTGGLERKLALLELEGLAIERV